MKIIYEENYNHSMEIEKEEKREQKKSCRISTWFLVICILITFVFAWGSIIKPDCFEPSDSLEEEEKEWRMPILVSLPYGVIDLKMNNNLTYTTGRSQGELNIDNSFNVYDYLVLIYLNDMNGNICEDKLIYQSPIIKIGDILFADTLDVNLPAGVYPVTVCFVAVEQDRDGEIYRCWKYDRVTEITILKSDNDAIDINSDWTNTVGEISYSNT